MMSEGSSLFRIRVQAVVHVLLVVASSVEHIINPGVVVRSVDLVKDNQHLSMASDSSVSSV